MTGLFNGLPEQPKPIPPLTIRDIVEVGDDGFIPDWRLAELLGFEHERRIRSLIGGHTLALERFGKLNRRSSVLGRRGPAAEVFLLNRKQALFIIAQSGADNAGPLLILMIEVFDAWLSGKLRPIDAETEATIADATEKAAEAAPELMELIGELRGQVDALTKRVATHESVDNLAQQIARTGAQIQRTVINYSYTPRKGPASKEHQRTRDYVVIHAYDGCCPICWPGQKTLICGERGHEFVHTEEYCEDHITGNRAKNGLFEMMPMCRRCNARMEKHRFDATIRQKIETFFAYLREYFPQLRL